MQCVCIHFSVAKNTFNIFLCLVIGKKSKRVKYDEDLDIGEH